MSAELREARPPLGLRRFKARHARRVAADDVRRNTGIEHGVAERQDAAHGAADDGVDLLSSRRVLRPRLGWGGGYGGVLDELVEVAGEVVEMVF